MEMKRTNIFVLFLLYGILIIGAVWMLLPLAWMTSAAFKPMSEIIQVPPTWIPKHFTLDNIKEVFKQVPFARYFLNSIVTTGVIVLSVLLTSTMAGYGFAKFNFKGKRILFLLILSSLMIPFQVRMIPLYQIAQHLKIVDTYLGVVFPWLFDAMGVFLMNQFMLTIPNELIEAARIDGASEGRIFFTIVIPQLKPAISALAIFTFSWSWEEFLWPLIVTNSDRVRTLPVGLQYFSEQYGINIHWQMAGAFVAILPVLIVFFIMQKQFVEGITLTGLKG
ncbi:carbohydrate ABC transporter permease [Caldanaerobacter subterraneus]|uniref:Carbohydrate ABC transporter membrane protein 2 (CUT1 family) n=2 Tax=Caldanaerobacter subterraneus TaxID=911092 RepID=A0A4R2JGU9_9THEO|nr:carbohydrate ABC transporter permease [Caldanaerobacter subterraneus]KKC30558.1 sugar permease [Caldanaerobacter subterraneus subsp. pacificus DSM 12653]TCO56186.1 carbohydrate ABC transporter membrane protein 2 (CUT1 family) [Caldanaerobacter subterraneus]